MPSTPYASAISGIESGGRYNALGPLIKSGDRAYGRYQVMGSNIPDWTKRFYGKSLTPDEFLSNQEAQDAVFQGQFGEYVNKYGPEGASKAWFAGEKGMNNPNAKDILGTTVADYAQKFTNAMGPQSAPPLPSPTNVASLPAPTMAQPAAGLLGWASNQAPGLLGGMNNMAGLGMGLMSGGNNSMPTQPVMAPPVRPRVDMSSLLAFLSQPRSGGASSWG